MVCVTANLLVLHNMNLIAHSCRLHGLPTILWFAPSWSDVVSVFTGISHSDQPSKSSYCVIETVYSSSEWTTADVSPKKSLRSCMIQTLNIRWWYLVSIAIRNVVTVKPQILFCSSRLRVPTSTYKTQLASMWSISCNIQHLAHQQSQHKIQWMKFWERTFRHSQQANTANWPSVPHDDVINQIWAKAAWKQNGSEHLELCIAGDL